MRVLFLMLFAAMLLAGCFVQTRGHRHESTARSRDCRPSYHWNGHACVHNGKAKGHHKR